MYEKKINLVNAITTIVIGKVYLILFATLIARYETLFLLIVISLGFTMLSMIYDVLISGAGICGRLLACALKLKGFKVLLLDKASGMPSDNRTSAISYSSSKILSRIGLWKDMESSVSPINDILISSEDSCSSFIHYDNDLVMGLPMGYTVPNKVIRAVLDSQDLDIEMSERCIGFTDNYGTVEVFLESGKSFKGKMFVVSEGKNSAFVDKLKIKVKQFDYKQSCIITSISHEKDHRDMAVEMFCKNGPFAILPTADRNRSAVIWTEDSDLVDDIIAMGHEDVLRELNSKCDLGVEQYDPLISYPVSLSFVTEYYRGRVVLFGDSLHSIHPVAGQGLNLSIGDLEMFLQSLNFGLGSELMLSSFYRKCLMKNLSMIAITDFLVRIFSSRQGVVRVLRSLGMAVVNESNFIKQFFIRRAMGI